MKIYAPGENLHNQLRAVKITGLYADGLLGVITDECVANHVGP